MLKPTVNLQDAFLNQIRKDGIPVTIFLTNGVRLTGTIRGFDNFSILIRHTEYHTEHGDRVKNIPRHTVKQEIDELIYKHSISTIIPHKPVENFSPGREEQRPEDV